MSKTTTIARMRRDGVLVRVNPDGSEAVMPVEPLAPMTPAEIEAVAWADPDARPFTPEEGEGPAGAADQNAAARTRADS